MIQKQQRGATLIELMISMVLGLALIAGIGQLFIQSQKSFRLQRNVSDMTDDASFILETIAKGVLLAGYSDAPDANPFSTPDVNPLSSTITLAANEYIHGTDNELIYRYQLDDLSQLSNFLCTDVLSATTSVDDVITVRIYKANDSNSIPVLYCKVKQNSDKNAEPLVSEVQQLVFKYGIQEINYMDTRTTSTGGIKGKNIYNPKQNRFYYTTAANIPLATEMNQITSSGCNGNFCERHVFAVKIFVVLRSSENNLTRTPITYNVDGTSYTATDNRIYKVFSKTIFLRGLIQ